MAAIAHKTTLLAMLALAGGCSDGTIPIELPFEVTFDGRPLGCSRVTALPGLSDLRFFVHDVALIRADGERAPVRLTPDGRWQSERVALIDLEDGTGGCVNGSVEMHDTVTGRTVAGDFDAIEFRIGVPEDLNHDDPILAEPPLNYSPMHWHWRSGYKFMRAGLVTDAEQTWLHLGSNRCSGTIGNISGCAAANRVEVRVSGFVPGRDVVSVDLAALFDGTDHEVGAGCSSGPAEPACAAPFAALDIDPGSGISRGGTRVFRSARRR